MAELGNRANTVEAKVAGCHHARRGRRYLFTVARLCTLPSPLNRNLKRSLPAVGAENAQNVILRTTGDHRSHGGRRISMRHPRRTVRKQADVMAGAAFHLDGPLQTGRRDSSSLTSVRSSRMTTAAVIRDFRVNCLLGIVPGLRKPSQTLNTYRSLLRLLFSTQPGHVASPGSTAEATKRVLPPKPQNG